MERLEIRGWTACAAMATGLLLGALPARAQGLCAQRNCAPDATQPSGAIYRICRPEPGCWNGDLAIWAHGYATFNEPLAIPEDQLRLPDGTSIPAVINALGYAFATTSYRTNGLAIKDGVDDVRELVDVFSGAHGTPGHTYLVGASEGGIVTAAVLISKAQATTPAGVETLLPDAASRAQYRDVMRALAPPASP